MLTDPKTALLIIDVQFGPMWGTYKAEEVLSTIRKLTVQAQNQTVPIFYLQHEDLPGGPLAHGTPFWQFHPGIAPQPEDTIVPKYAADAFYKTKLQTLLKQHGIAHLVVTGARTDYCIDTTCRAALSLGFDVTLVENGHTCADGILSAEQVIQHHNAILNNLSTPETKLQVLPSDRIFLEI